MRLENLKKRIEKRNVKEKKGRKRRNSKKW